MVPLGKIIQILEKNFQVRVEGSCDGEEKIATVQFLTPPNNDVRIYQPYVLYLAVTTDFNLPDESVVLLIDAALVSPRKNTLSINRPLNPLDVHNVINMEIINSISIDKEKEEMFSILQSGGGIKSILEVAHSYLRNPVVICDTNFSIIEGIPEHHNPIDFEEQGSREILTIASIESMHKKDLINKIFKSKDAFFTYNEISNMNVLMCGVRINRSVVGLVVAAEQANPFKDIDIEYVQVLAQMLSIEIQKRGNALAKGELKYESLLKTLFDGKLSDRSYVEQRFSQLGYQLSSYLYIITFACDLVTDKHINPRYYVDQLNYICKRGLSFIYRDTPVMLLFSDKPASPFSDEEELRLEDFLKLNQLYAAVSYPFTNVLNTQYYYSQSADILHFLKKDVPDKNILYFEDYCLFGLLKNVEPLIPLQTAIHPDILSLRDYDLKHNTDYMNTLRNYVFADRNALKTAAALNIHKSTFFYRLSKIGDILGVSLDNGRKLFLYELSFHIIDFIGLESIN
ncbi:PucR family transcriptional regulator [Parasporobacterium paucivorans]|uniref:Sugar diacid utilization regulator n=1 Tax=Parasporobacterium paucivorans DSM 15970 TaxID=1122934 RepID=A0A1M6J888_9FIRM|nr:PucR family transcriptional regulator [Parasporobacterium paucivorans]SHJ42884.1 Sugar diacid utilization regulator [Parasporobacterium paucivorans DSM 15970]